LFTSPSKVGGMSSKNISHLELLITNGRKTEGVQSFLMKKLLRRPNNKDTYGKQMKEFIHSFILQTVQEYTENVIHRTHKLAKQKHSHISNGHHASSTIHNIHILLYKPYTPYLKLTTGHGETPAAGSWGRITGTRFTTENASLRRAARLMNWDTFCTQWRKLIKTDIFDCEKK